ncbi:MAG: glycosyltransferase family 4 protein, partial [Gelidibacter sp.]
MKKTLKIAIYSGEIPSTTFIERLITGVAASGTDVILFGSLHKQPAYISQVKVVGYRSTRLSKFWHLLRFTVLLTLFKRAEKKRLDRYLKQQQTTDLYTKVKFYPILWYQPDVFHVQWAKGLDDWIWVQEFGMKLVLSLRGAHINYSPIADLALAKMYQLNFPKVDGFHAVSEAIALESTKYGANSEAIRVVKSGLNLEDFAFKLKEFDSNVPLNIVSVGRDHWKKNYHSALDAMFILKQQGVPFQYHIIGVAENEALVFQRAQLGLEKEVSFIETMPFNRVKEVIQQADVLLLPSVEEGIANVVLEAMALGTLVVSTDCGGMAEVVFPQETGYLVPVRDVQAMAMTLVEVSQLSLEDYQGITLKAREFVERNHSEEKMVAGMMWVYERVVGRGESV